MERNFAKENARKCFTIAQIFGAAGVKEGHFERLASAKRRYGGAGVNG